ncbi:hypothetical protein JCM11491_003867 [Sporobolomyces phaffii]
MTNPTEPTLAWIDYAPRPGGGGGGSTFFVPTGSGSSRMTDPAPLPDLPFPRSILLSPAPSSSPAPPANLANPSNPSSPTRVTVPGPPRPLAAAAGGLTYAPALPRPTLPPSMATSTKVPLAQSSTIVAHSGFWDLLGAAGAAAAASSRFYSPSKIAARTETARRDRVRTERIGKGIASRPVGPNEGVASSSPSVGPDPFLGRGEANRDKKKVTKELIGGPRAFAHLVHASDAEQAEALLTRWHLDKQGKLGQPAWANPIKSAVREAKRAVGINEAITNRDDEREDQALRVVNGLPDSAFSHLDLEPCASCDTRLAVENDDHRDLSPPSSPSSGRSIVLTGQPGDTKPALIDPVRPRTPPPPVPAPARTITRIAPPPVTRSVLAGAGPGTTKFSPRGDERPGVPLSWDAHRDVDDDAGVEAGPERDSTGVVLSDPFSLPSEFVPSLATIERAAALKIYLETKYYAVLKTVPARAARLGRLEADLARVPNLSDADKAAARAAWHASESAYLRAMRRPIAAASFARVRVIGRGAFGVVSLVRERATGQVFAMKQLRKADMLRKGQEGHVRAERDLLAKAVSAGGGTRWTVRLAYSFQDQDHLYLVMDAMMGGDLLTLLIEKDTFEESFAKFYVAEMVLAIQETHQVLGAIHRDIKPDNFLFSREGHIAISDFGLATDFHWSHDAQYFESQRNELLHRHGIDLEQQQRARPRPPGRRTDGDARAIPPFDPPGEDEGTKSLLGWRDRNRRRMAYSVVGTNNYVRFAVVLDAVSLAVEVLRGTGYEVQADWWSLGVIMFEMLYGYPPFVSKSRQQTRDKILNWRQSLRFPAKPRVSREAQDLILSLICEKEHRLGSRTPPSVIQRRRSGYLDYTTTPSTATLGGGGVPDDGAEAIKAHAWFAGVEWDSLHLQTPPFRPDLTDDTDARYFEDDIEAVPLPAPEIAPGVAAPDTTRDPMLSHSTEGARVLELRKDHAFKDWTFRKPKSVEQVQRGLFGARGERRGGGGGGIFAAAAAGEGEGEAREPPGNSDESAALPGGGSSLIRSMSV